MSELHRSPCLPTSSARSPTKMFLVLDQSDDAVGSTFQWNPGTHASVF